ncbi:MAG: response regulator transcription factor [Anaerolineae bacterium]
MYDDGQIHLYILDNHRLVRSGLKALLADFHELEIIGTASTGQEAIEECTKLQPDVILTEVILDDMDSIEVIEKLCEVSPASQIVVLTYQKDRTPVYEALQAGVTGYLINDISTEELVDAVKHVANGEKVISPEIVPQLVDQATKSDPNVGANLTEREREVLDLMPDGLSNKEIAKRLSVSPSTIRITSAIFSPSWKPTRG